MRLSLDWLSDHVDLAGLGAREVGEALTLHVAEVGSVEEPFAGIRVARVVGVRSHPNAEKLRLVTLEDGTETTEVVCGARNVEAGQRALAHRARMNGLARTGDYTAETESSAA